LARQNPTSGTDPGRRVHVVREGDRIDLIAYDYYKDAFVWRLIADANRLTDPSNLQPGAVLEIPLRYS
jgi:nucleoid-associated protein YgaU